MATILVAVLGVFIILSVWVGIDLLARKQLGERHHGCRGHHGPGCRTCQMLNQCARDGERGEDREPGPRPPTGHF